jgi:hypothetical protein
VVWGSQRSGNSGRSVRSWIRFRRLPDCRDIPPSSNSFYKRFGSYDARRLDTGDFDGLASFRRILHPEGNKSIEILKTR